MNSCQLSNVLSFLIIFLIVQCEGETELGDYIVDCSGCNYLLLKGVDSYHCNIQCEAQGEYFQEYTINNDHTSR